MTAIAGAAFPGKPGARRQIAFCYGIMAALQLVVVLLTTSRYIAPGLTVVLPLLAGATYLLAGQRLFLRTGQRVFDVGLTGMIASFGLVLLAT